jgi:hypothetical protein
MLQATGLSSPAQLRLHHIMRRVSEQEVRNMSELLPSLSPSALVNDMPLEGLFAQYWHQASTESFQLKA